MGIKVLLADDHALICDGVKSIFDRQDKNIQVVAVAKNGKEVLEKAKTIPIDIFVLDISMPIMNGLETAAALIKKDPQRKIIILSMHDSRVFVEKAMNMGVKGYLIKESAPEEIITAVHEVSAGRFYISPRISEYLVHAFLQRKSTDAGRKYKVELTPTERQVLQLLAEGSSTKEIAKQMGTTPGTIAVHRRNIMQKLDIHKQTELVHYAIKEGIIII